MGSHNTCLLSTNFDSSILATVPYNVNYLTFAIIISPICRATITRKVIVSLAIKIFLLFQNAYFLICIHLHSSITCIHLGAHLFFFIFIST